ncbi:hypothetical protein GOP47_0004544 [Adiantum capillus-veneris]|uniref:Uncharacterized protein n=1 Tax=Adiantum capillus-veneris TaxID=13818 RepID=A0A9D4V7N3_ADICA|nr:hypothetical protein GOP47_0004544 [Adiantum capillus-veneris]
MDLDNQSLDHDELLGVEALEDIIDVENEMGFGEGEDWSHDDGTIGYGKLAASRKRGLFNKASAMHGRPRTKPVTIHPHQSRKPLNTIRHGHKHGIVSPPEREERSQMNVMVNPGVKYAFGPSNDSAKKLKVKEAAKDDTNEMLQTTLEIEGGNAHSLRSSHDEEDMQGFCMGLDAKGDSPSVDGSKHDCTQRERNAENALKSDEIESDQEHAHIEARKALAKREEKAASSNRVRFSLDVETADKVTGYANRRSTEAKEKSKCSKQQEWRYVRSIPSDSNGFGTPKVPPTGASVRATSTQRRKEASALESTKDPALGFDLEKAIEMRDDKKAARLALERVERFEDAMLKQQEIVANMKLSLVNEGTKDYAKLRQLVDALDRNIKKVSVSSKAHQVPQSYVLKNRAEQINRLKAQCNLLETDRERLKKKLRHFLESEDAKEKEQEVPKKGGESEGSVNERESLLEQKVKDLERALAEWETKCKKGESDFAIERALLEDSLTVSKLDWRNKQQRWSSKMKEREAELSDLKASQDELVDSIVSCRQCMDKLRMEAVSYKRGLAPHGAFTETQEEDAVPKNIEDTNALGLAYGIQNDTESLRRLLVESSSILQDNPRLQSEFLRQESKVLENKVTQTITLMTEVKQEMKAKEDQIKKENEKYAEVVADKVKHVETLMEQLADKEKDMEGFLQELKDKVSLLNKKLECERSEKSRLSELQGNMKYKLLKGLRKKEQKLEEEIEGMKERLEEMQTTIAQKDERLASMEDEVNSKCAQLVQEKQKWNMAIKEVKQKAAKTILRFMHGKENGLLEYLRERKKGHKAGEARGGLLYKTDDDRDDDDDDCENKVSQMYQEGLSKKILREKLYSKKRMLSGRLDSPRDSQQLLSSNFDDMADLRSSFESQKEKARQDYDLSRKDDLCLQEKYSKAFKFAGRNRAMERREF